jgi:hypothetical protein
VAFKPIVRDTGAAIDPVLKAKIDALSHEQLAYHWRFARSGDPLLSGQTGDYFAARLFNHFGGITPEISKKIGWEVT